MLIRPKKESLFVKRLGKELYLNSFTLGDEEWINNRWTKEELAKVFDAIEPDMRGILSLFWRLLDDDSKRLVRDVKLVKWEGLLEKPVEVDDPAEKLMLILSGEEEVRGVVGAILKSKKGAEPSVQDNQKKSPAVADQSATTKSLS